MAKQGTGAALRRRRDAAEFLARELQGLAADYAATPEEMAGWKLLAGLLRARLAPAKGKGK